MADFNSIISGLLLAIFFLGIFGYFAYQLYIFYIKNMKRGGNNEQPRDSSGKGI